MQEFGGIGVVEIIITVSRVNRLISHDFQDIQLPNNLRED